MLNFPSRKDILKVQIQEFILCKLLLLKICNDEMIVSCTSFTGFHCFQCIMIKHKGASIQSNGFKFTAKICLEHCVLDKYQVLMHSIPLVPLADSSTSVVTVQ